MRYLFLIAALIAALITPTASAATGDIYFEFMAAARWPWDPDQGLVHALGCVQLHLTGGIKEDCYGFYPQGGSVKKVILKDGHELIRMAGNRWSWDQSGPLTQEQLTCNELVLIFNKGRIRYELPSGAFYWQRSGGKKIPWGQVVGIERESAGFQAVRGPGMFCREFNTTPARFTNVDESFEVKIDESKRNAILAAMNNWNRSPYSLTQDSCIDYIHEVAGILNLKRPDRSRFQLPTAYVKALREANS